MRSHPRAPGRFVPACLLSGRQNYACFLVSRPMKLLFGPDNEPSELRVRTTLSPSASIITVLPSTLYEHSDVTTPIVRYALSELNSITTVPVAFAYLPSS